MYSSKSVTPLGRRRRGVTDLCTTARKGGGEARDVFRCPAGRLKTGGTKGGGEGATGLMQTPD